MRLFKRVVVSALLTVAGTAVCMAQQAGGNKITAEEDSLNQAVAVVMAANLNEVISDLARANVMVSPAEVGRYIADILAGKELGFSRLYANAYVENKIRSNRPERPESYSVESQNEYLEKAMTLPGAVKLPSGVVFVVLTEGEGVFPTEDDQVKVNYVAALSDGTLFDDTEGEAVTFDVSKVIPGFAEGLMQMKPGGRYRVIIPPALGYGEAGIPGIIPGNAVLDFTVTLEEVVNKF